MHKFFFCLFCVLTASLLGADFHQLQDDYFAGKYHVVLRGYETLANNWLEEGVFDEYLQKRRSEAFGAYERQCSLDQRKKLRSKELGVIEEKKNEELQYLCDRYPHAEITPLLRDILSYHRLRAEHHEALEFFKCLELGIVETGGDPLISKLQKIIQDYDFKSIVVSSQVVNCEIDQETGFLHKTLLDLDRNDILTDICRAHPNSEAAKLCLEALVVQHAMLPVFLNQKYLCDLLVGARPPANVVEDRARQILQIAHIQKEGLLVRE